MGDGWYVVGGLFLYLWTRFFDVFFLLLLVLRYIYMCILGLLSDRGSKSTEFFYWRYLSAYDMMEAWIQKIYHINEFCIQKIYLCIIWYDECFFLNTIIWWMFFLKHHNMMNVEFWECIFVSLVCWSYHFNSGYSCSKIFLWPFIFSLRQFYADTFETKWTLLYVFHPTGGNSWDCNRTFYLFSVDWK